MATSMCRLRPIFGRLINTFDKRILYSNSNLRTYTASSTIICSNIFSNRICYDKALVLNGRTKDVRHFCTDKNLADEKLSERVLQVCKSFDRIPTDKLTLDSHFMEDLGLDSLDHVELIMNIEDDFGFEIPDSDAEKLLRPRDIVAYIEQKGDISSKQ